MQDPCHNSSMLIPSYLDGELSEEQAAPLRRHLMECQSCRDLAQDEQAMKRWFIADEASVAPPGFAARVARRAFAGDAGVLPDSEFALQPQVGSSGETEQQDPTLRFVLRLTAIAAAVLFCLALAIRTHNLPESADLGASEDYTQVVENLQRMNAAEEAAAAGDTARDLPREDADKAPIERKRR